MATFALSTTDNYADVIGAINYALANLGTNFTNSNIGGNIVTANTTTGVISTVDSGTIGYLDGFVNIKYANSSTGGSGFSSNSANKSYYGVNNTTDGSISSNPSDYSWSQVTGGFGTTKSLWYQTLGGQQIRFFAGNAAPNINYRSVQDDTAIALITLAPSIVTANTIVAATITNVQIASNTITATNIQANTITAAQIAAGTITTDKLAANVLVANTIVSTGATLNVSSGTGFWFNGNTGNAYMGGTTIIGNTLVVGNNAVIGGNLNVTGLITAGSLQSNTVATTTIVNQAVSQGNAASSTTDITVAFPTSGAQYYYTYANTAINLTSTAGISNYVSGVLVTDIELDNSVGTDVWILTFSLYRNTTALVTETFRYDVPTSITGARYNNITPFSYLDTGLSANTNYVYSMSVSTTNGNRVPQLILASGTLISQVLKR